MATFIPNLRVTTETPGIPLIRPFAYVDNLFSYQEWFRTSGGAGKPLFAGPSMKNPNSSDGEWRIAIVGAGAAGLAAAYELGRSEAGLGLSIDVYEATNRIGGRTWSAVFGTNQPELAELGAMRFPPTEEILFHYLGQFGIEYTGGFPDPGRVPTVIHYRNKSYKWGPAIPLPAEFERVNKGWNAFVANGKPSMGLESPLKLYDTLLKYYNDPTNISSVVPAWQKYIDTFKDQNFYKALVTIYGDSNAPGGEPWEYDDYAVFAALGIGSGGFGPLYNIGFLDIVRLIVNGLETDQVFIPGGIGQVVQTLYRNRNTDRVSVISNAGVYQINKKDPGNGESQFELSISNGGKKIYDRVIVATTTRSMQLSIKMDTNETLFPAPTAAPPRYAEGIRRLHMINSSKLFIRTKDKFWLNSGLPHTIQSDTLIRGLYCLDYTPSNPNGSGVVLVSYTWEDDSAKVQAVPNPPGNQILLGRFQEDINNIYPGYGDYLVPLNNDYEVNVKRIDWQNVDYQYGAFKLDRPGQEPYVHDLFFHFQDAAMSNSLYHGLFLAGDGVSWTGGWVEGGLQTALNAVAGVIQSLTPYGALFTSGDYNPITSMNKSTYTYE